MPRPCTVCSHDDRDLIDAALVQQIPKRRVAARFSVPSSCVRRHAVAHLPKILVHAAGIKELAPASELLADVHELHARTLAILDEAEDNDDARTALHAIREARSCVELLGRLAGELSNEATLNVTLDARWTEVRSVVVRSLEAFPEARVAVAAALEQMVER